MGPRIAVIILVGFALGRLAANPPSRERIAQLYENGLVGDREAVEECITALETALRANPDNQLARVYLGSSYTLRSRDLGFGPKKLAALREGVATMNAAVKAAPEDAKIRLVRALTLHALPGFLGHKKTARGEFFALAHLIEEHPEKLSANDRQTVFLQAGKIAFAANDKATALAFWRRGSAIAADNKMSTELRALLAKNGS